MTSDRVRQSMARGICSGGSDFQPGANGFKLSPEPDRCQRLRARGPQGTPHNDLDASSLPLFNERVRENRNPLGLCDRAYSEARHEFYFGVVVSPR
jgi:hypothetical protein